MIGSAIRSVRTTSSPWSITASGAGDAVRVVRGPFRGTPYEPVVLYCGSHTSRHDSQPSDCPGWRHQTAARTAPDERDLYLPDWQPLLVSARILLSNAVLHLRKPLSFWLDFLCL